MVSILLLILKILGFILLALISLILVILSIILFVPIRYEIDGSKEDVLIASTKVSWLLKIVKLDVLYQKTLKYRIKVLWKTIKVVGFEAEKKANKKPKKSKPLKKVKRKVNKKVKKKVGKEVKPEVKKAVDNVSKTEAIKSFEPLSTPSHMNEMKTTPVAEKEEVIIPKKQSEDKGKLESQASQTKDTTEEPKSLLSKAKEVYEKIRTYMKDESYKGVIKFVAKHVWKIIKSILPKKSKIQLEFGLEDPSMTGITLGVISIFYAVLGNSMVIKPDFEKKVMKGKVHFKGRIYLFIIVYHAVIVLLDKRVKKIIAENRN